MALLRTVVSFLQRMFYLPRMPLDAAESRPVPWAAMLGGAGLGLLWGVLARVWMRLIAVLPEFTIPGTVAILLIATLFGLWVGLAFAARRRGWRGWRHYLPRALVVAFFLPFGIAGGGPLMFTVLLLTLAVAQPAAVGLWVLAALAMLILLTTDIALPAGVAISAFVVAGALTVWKAFALRWGGAQAARVDRWIDVIGRGLILMLGAGGFVSVVREILHDKPGLPGIALALAYAALLYPLFLALRVGLEPRGEVGE